jgi:hypothetical protein
LSAALVLPVALLTTRLPRLAPSPFVILGTVTVILVPVTLSAAWLPVLGALIALPLALALIALLSLSLTALILIVLLSHGVSLIRHRARSTPMQGLYDSRNRDGLFLSRSTASHLGADIVGAQHDVSLVIPLKQALMDKSRNRTRAQWHGDIGACRDIRQTKGQSFGLIQPADGADD